MTFKNSHRQGLAVTALRRRDVISRTFALLTTAALLALCGCSVLQQKMPAVDLKEPGWTVRHGQAVWRMPGGRTELAGDILVALKAPSQAFVEFSKAPFPVATVQFNGTKWEALFPPHKRYAGRGTPPKRIIWLQLARIMTGQSPPPNWSWHQEAAGWRLTNPANGEAVQGYFE